MPCTDEGYRTAYDAFQGLAHPLVLTLGDNDWTDCIRIPDGQFSQEVILNKLRTMFFPEGTSLGRRTIVLENQARDPQYSKYRENLRWSIGGVGFATVHIVGSNDNLLGSPEMNAEHAARKAANIAWL